MTFDVAVSDPLFAQQQQTLNNLARPTTRSLGLYNAGCRQRLCGRNMA
jgi:histidinol-phosphate aminotransferase